MAHSQRSFEPPERHRIDVPLLDAGGLRVAMLLSTSVGDLACATRVQVLVNDEVALDSPDGPSILQIEQGRVDERSPWLLELRRLVEGSEALGSLLASARAAAVPVGDAVRFSRFEIYAKACDHARRSRAYDGLGARAPRADARGGAGTEVYRIRRPSTEAGARVRVFVSDRAERCGGV